VIGMATKPVVTDPISTDLKRVMRQLKLGRMLDTLPERLTLAHQRHLSHAAFLELILADEATRRDNSSAAHAIHELNHRAQPSGDDLVYPADTAAIIATLAHMTGMLPQLLAQLTRWLTHQHQDGRLTLDSLEARPGLAPTMHALTDSLQHAIRYAQHTAAELDTAHQHAAHLAAAEPATNYQAPNTNARGQNSCRSLGPNHLTKRTAARRAREAGLDATMRLDSWDDSAAVSYDRTLWTDLTSLRFLDGPHGALLLGPVGVGKTHLATTLGHIAVRRRIPTLMLRADAMFKRLEASRLDNSTEAEMRRLAQVRLLIIDDFALQPMDATATADFYELVVARHQRGSTVLTSNRSPDEWLAVMTDPLLAQSAVDRVTTSPRSFWPGSAAPRACCSSGGPKRRRWCGAHCASPEIVEGFLSRFWLLTVFPDLVVDGR